MISGRSVTDSADPRADLAARRTAVLVVVAIVVAVMGVLIGAISRLGDDDPAPTDDPAVRRDDRAPDAAAAIGPAAGTDVTQYLATRQQALATATGTQVAVVSFTGYVTANEAARAIGSGLETVATLVALPGEAPASAASDAGGVAAWLATAQRAAKVDRASIAAMVGDVGDPEFVAFYESELARLDAILALTPTGRFVFAVGVRGDAAALQAIAKAPRVRLVDIGEGRSTTRSYRGLRPEEVLAAGDPETRVSAP
jgi:hypothetical protein